jgi:CRISPR-associated protein Csb1
LPLLVLRTTVHDRPVRLTALEFPHRVSDAYLRDCYLDGEVFDRTELGRAVRRSALRDATAIYRVCPTALVYGTWDSHRGKPERSFKVPRSYVSELFGTNPRVGDRVGSRLDPLGMLGGKVTRGDGTGEWELLTIESEAGEETVTRAKSNGKADKLSNVGHGNVAPTRVLGGVAVDGAQRCAVVSLAGLRRLRFPVDGTRDVDRDAAGRAALAALAILGDRLAFGLADLSLRSGCDLVVEEDRVELVHRGGDVKAMELSVAVALRLFEDAVETAESCGLGWQRDPVELTPRENLQQALEANLLDV